MDEQEYLKLRRKSAENNVVSSADAKILKEFEQKYIQAYGPNWVTTISGNMISILKPNPKSICLEDIAHGLSMICRYNGHVRKFYSVAQHSVYVSKLVPKKHAMHGLMHDASEALIGDVISPVKREIGEAYKSIEERLMKAVAKKFEFDFSKKSQEVVKEYDMLMLRTEMRDLTNYCYKSGKTLRETIVPQSQEEAKESFINRYREIMRGSWDISQDTELTGN